jgi:hypothetical protein
MEEKMNLEDSSIHTQKEYRYNFLKLFFYLAVCFFLIIGILIAAYAGSMNGTGDTNLFFILGIGFSLVMMFKSIHWFIKKESGNHQKNLGKLVVYSVFILVIPLALGVFLLIREQNCYSAASSGFWHLMGC